MLFVVVVVFASGYIYHGELVFNLITICLYI